MKVKTSWPAIRRDDSRIRCVENVRLGEFRLLATLFRIPRPWSKKLVKDKGGWLVHGWRSATKRAKRKLEERRIEVERNEKGDKKDGREFTGSEPPASPRQLRLQGFLLHGLCSGYRLGYRGSDATRGQQLGPDDGEPTGGEWNRTTPDRGHHHDPGGGVGGATRGGGSRRDGGRSANTRGSHN